jgi:hypothetical protein
LCTVAQKRDLPFQQDRCAGTWTSSTEEDDALSDMSDADVGAVTTQLYFGATHNDGASSDDRTAFRWRCSFPG